VVTPAGRRPAGTPKKVQEASSEGYEAFKTDLGPWVETPNSSRVSRYRYDYHNRAIQVQWTNQSNHGYVYRDVEYEDFRSFVRAMSKGKRINSHLNGYQYELMTPDEVDAPSNMMRYGPTSRARG
jgi:hypothetical protein